MAAGGSSTTLGSRRRAVIRSASPASTGDAGQAGQLSSGRQHLACKLSGQPTRGLALYVPEDWAADPERRTKACVPDEVRFATKTQIALQQLRALLDEGAPRHCVLADAGYGVDNAFRQALSDMGLLSAVGVTSAVVVWPPGVQPLPPKRHSCMGRPPVALRRAATLQPMSVKALAMSLPPEAFQTIAWREGTNAPLRERFAAVRVRHAGCNFGEARLRPEQWLLIEWPAHEAEPSKYFLSTLPDYITINELVSLAHQRWRIERDHRDLKKDFGLALRGPRLARVPLSCSLKHRGLRTPNGRTPHRRQASWR